MRNPAFRDVFFPEDLAESICFAYGFSGDFCAHLARFLDQAPANPGGRYRSLDEYVALFVKRLGWSRPHARMFVAGEWPTTLLPRDFQQEIMRLEGVA